MSIESSKIRNRVSAAWSVLLAGLLTLPGAAQAPNITVVTGEVDNITMNAARLHGMINPNGCTGARYRFWYSENEKMDGAAFSSTTPEATAGASSGNQPVEVQLSGLKPGTTYYYRLLAWPPQAAGAKRPSQPNLGQVRSFRTGFGPGPVVAAPPPRKPVDLLVESFTDSSVTLAWNIDPEGTGPMPHHFVVERRGPNTTFTPAAQVQGTNVNAGRSYRYTLCGLLAGISYLFRVKSVSGLLSSPYSEEVSATTARLSGGGLSSPHIRPLAAPRLVSAQFRDRIHVFLSWNQPKEEDPLIPKLQSFRIERSEINPNQFVDVGTFTVAENRSRHGNFTIIYENMDGSNHIRGLSEGIKYFFRVRAVNSAGASEPSNYQLVIVPKND